MSDIQRVAVYCRVSTKNQRETTIENDEARCRAEADKHGWQVVKVYSDFAMSGSTGHYRPGYSALLSAIEASERGACPFDAVLVVETSRLWRNMALQGPMEELCADRGVYVVGLDDGYDSRREGNEWAGSSIGTRNAVQRKYIAVKVQRSHKGAAAGGFNVGGCPYGYVSRPVSEPATRSTPKKLVIHEPHAAVVRRVFDLYAGGMSAPRIAWTLNSEGVAPPSARWPSRVKDGVTLHSNKWRASGIYGMLDNSAYVGRRSWGATRNNWLRDADAQKRALKRTRQKQAGDARDAVTVGVPAIITEALWKRAAARRLELSTEYAARVAAKSGIKNPQRPGRPSMLLLPLVCGHCGRAYTRADSHKLACSSRMASCRTEPTRGGRKVKRNGSRPGWRTDDSGAVCTMDQRAYLDTTYERILGSIRSELTGDGVVRQWAEKVAARRAAEQRRTTRPDVAALRADRRKAQAEVDALVEAIAAGGLRGSPALAARLRAAEAQVSRLDDAVAAAGRPVASVRDLPDLGDLARRFDKLVALGKASGTDRVRPDLVASARTALTAMLGGPVRVFKTDGGPVARWSLGAAALDRVVNWRPEQELNL